MEDQEEALRDVNHSIPQSTITAERRWQRDKQSTSVNRLKGSQLERRPFARFEYSEYGDPI